MKELLQFALSTSLFQSLLRRLAIFLLLTFQQSERQVGHGILRFLQAEVGQASDNLNARDSLVRSDFSDNQVKFRLRFSGFTTGSGTRASGHDHAARRRGGIDAERFFDLGDEFRGFHEGERFHRFNDFVGLGRLQRDGGTSGRLGLR